MRTYADGIHAGRIKPTNHTTDAGSAISIIEYPRSSYHDRLFAAGIYHAEWCNSILHQSQKECKEQIERLQIISQIILYPAIFLLAIGIFIGAVWANVSWGRYWGWDPKEVWALITMLVYALALHPRSLPWFHRTMFFHVFCITAFITVLITYFGVNFLLGGMHSYANG